MKRLPLAIAGLIGVALVIAAVVLPYDGESWQPPSLSHPLGTDAIGRDYLSLLIRSMFLSAGRAILIVITAVGVSSLFAIAVVYFGGALGYWLVRSVANVIESTPVVLWIFIVVIALGGGAPILAASAAFVIVTLPILTNVLTGEIERLKVSDMCQAARAMGVSEARILMLYILPNAVPVLLPVTVNFFGAALTVFGALGLVGLGNRSFVDIGTILLIGKENIIWNPYILIAAGTGIFAIYIAVDSVVAKILTKFDGATRSRESD